MEKRASSKERIGRRMRRTKLFCAEENYWYGNPYVRGWYWRQPPASMPSVSWMVFRRMRLVEKARFLEMLGDIPTPEIRSITRSGLFAWPFPYLSATSKHVLGTGSKSSIPIDNSSSEFHRTLMAWLDVPMPPRCVTKVQAGGQSLSESPVPRQLGR
jgi:hypothetical protein